MIKLVKRRDSATSALRKLGVQPRDYNLFIKAVDGQFAYDPAAIKAHLDALKSPAKPIKATTPQPAKAKNVTMHRTVAATMREMIRAGKTNKDIWYACKREFNLDDSKRHYPCWYRCEMRRRGEVAA